MEPNKSLVWKGVTGEWMMKLYIDSKDAFSSHLITRMQYKTPDKFKVAWWLDKLGLDGAHCVMQRGMLMGIKQRVENLLK